MKVRDVTPGTPVQFRGCSNSSNGYEIIDRVETLPERGAGYIVWFRTGRNMPCKGHEDLEGVICQNRYKYLHNVPKNHLQPTGES